jgi:hypothetical protein
MPVGGGYGQHVIRERRLAAGYTHEVLLPVVFVPLV